MLEPMRIAGDDRRFITVYVISMIAVTVRTVTVVLVVVVVVVVMGFTRGVVVMDVRMVSSAVAMIEGAHYIDLIRANPKWSLHTLKEKSPFRRWVNAVCAAEVKAFSHVTDELAAVVPPDAECKKGEP